ncbi:DUF1501 domain-containing protein [Silvibacterium dinghuense]|uniref:DUF1501 domain-containing protein n=1 Tax=Silvibacterium dinghuense TaxID=1560006 RepID=A0A4Q1SED9_9BACT|nr:DUF1501 domain-containing protein [Silvibacterium dinghuense]RXS95487.1 DUF1501 domain-containing protein [Silvibacterium dinghuense]
MPLPFPTRRAFLKSGALAVVGTAAIPSFLTRSVLAQATTAQAQGKRLVVIFQRGAADGLNIVVPWREKAYYDVRPTIAIPQKQVLDLDGFFGFHPAMAPLKPLWNQKHLAIVHACGSPDPTRSHFDAQDFMESGTPGMKATNDGWLNRALATETPAHHGESPFRAVALGTQLPRTLQGRIPAVAVNNVKNFTVGAAEPTQDFSTMYDESVNAVLHGTGQETFEAVRMLKATNPASYVPAAGANYPNTAFGNSMKQIAQLLKANLGVETAFADIGGWDTHQNQGSVNGQLAGRLKEMSESLAAFWTDMGDQAESITLVTMSEFGRTVHQNGTGGTDHGHANVMFVMGGQVAGGKVYGKWPGMEKNQLYEERDLAITTDFRQVLGESVYKTLGARNLNAVFPDSGIQSNRFPGLLKA